MGVDIIKIGLDVPEPGSVLTEADLAQVAFQHHLVPGKDMSILLKTLSKGKPIFPWWSYSGALDGDIEALNKEWAVSNPQNLYDLLFLNQLYRFADSNFYVIFPGNIKTNGWGRLNEDARATFLRGQGCLYHLEGSLKSKININWVPFYHPQSMVKDPRFENMWRLFASKQDPNDDTNCLSFFSLRNYRNLPTVIKLLCSQDENRSEKMAELVDWFGLYSSPLKDDLGTLSVMYSKDSTFIPRIADLETKVQKQFEQAKQELLKNPTPKTVLRFLSRNIIF